MLSKNYFEKLSAIPFVHVAQIAGFDTLYRSAGDTGGMVNIRLECMVQEATRAGRAGSGIQRTGKGALSPICRLSGDRARSGDQQSCSSPASPSAGRFIPVKSSENRQRQDPDFCCFHSAILLFHIYVRPDIRQKH